MVKYNKQNIFVSHILILYAYCGIDNFHLITQNQSKLEWLHT